MASRLRLVEWITPEMSVLEVSRVMRQRAPSWAQVLTETEPELKRISDLIEAKGPFLPGNERLFRAFELTPLENVRVVIFGQDPYPTVLPNGQPRAQGLAFSVGEGDEIPGSLRNIYEEIKAGDPNYNPPHSGDLTHWAKQGVLLLNACLTCPPGVAGGHSRFMLWMPFILKVLKALPPRCIYVLWGKEAQKLQTYLGEKAVILTAGHPSPLSVKGFTGCRHFVKINCLLKSWGQTPITW